MAEDLFEEENENEEKSSEKQNEIFSDEKVLEGPSEADEAMDAQDEEAWIPLDEEELDISPADENTDAPLEDGEIDYDEIAEDYAGEGEGVGLGTHSETDEISSADGAMDAQGKKEAWIPLDEEELDISPADEKTDAPLEDEEIDYDEIAENYSEEDEVIEEEADSEREEFFEDENAGVFADDEDEEAEIPPWEEGIEIPIHGTASSSGKNKLFMIMGILVFLALIVIGLYVFLQPNRMLVKEEVKSEEEEPLFVKKKMVKMPVEEPVTEKIPVGKDVAEKEPEKMPPPQSTPAVVNTAPIIIGDPVTRVKEGSPYRFSPNASDIDPGDKLMFFIANQPAWASFDTKTGILTGMPTSKDVGTHENIVILVSDGTATASLPSFSITVTGVSPEIPKQKQVPQIKLPLAAKPEKKTVPQQQPEIKKEAEKTEVGQYRVPDLTELLKQSEFQDAALEYHKEVIQFPESYSFKLEVVCMAESVQLAFEKVDFDRRMFILPREISGKGCFAVFWGLYATKNEAIKALSSIPAFFSKQETKPQLVIIKQYL